MWGLSHRSSGVYLVGPSIYDSFIQSQQIKWFTGSGCLALGIISTVILFSQNYGTVTRKAVHFYGNDGICLFKYFDDPRRSRKMLQNMNDIIDHKGDAMMWSILILNLACLVAISVYYVFICILTKISSDRS